MNTTQALTEIEAANDTHADDPEGFDADKQSYNRVLTEAEEIGGSELVDALTERIVQDIRAANERPGPTAVRQHAVDLCERKEIDIPEGSELSGQDATGSDAELGNDPF
ncbi:hypothetical protein [Halohasta litorea]|uniref:Uncharacterized protein n=1 Tax=Halohasta litorea TaxID=869891 RepID=A0ABD6D7P8_9EURY|nr:hypothetical protein [Halohasta litorea]MEA1931727.1 hypothetical protein [Euryarchaeota archaeon]